MITILLTILKFLGILLLILLLTAIVLLLLVLFVPIRYRIDLRRRDGDDAPISINIKVSWLMHLVNAAFSYPEAAFLRVRLFCFTLFRSDKKKSSASKNASQKTNNKTEEAADNHQQSQKDQPKKTSADQDRTQALESDGLPEPDPKPEPSAETDTKKNIFTKIHEFWIRLQEFFRKLMSLFQNIRYTITQICDKIKHIVNNIQYYMKILKSDTFSRAWTVCSGQVFSLLKSILPGKLTGSLVIGTGDPASTGQVLAIYGILYPLLGNHINVTPDFERQIIEGELFIKGKITVFKGLKTAWKIYFNRDLRRLIQLFKREAA